MSDEKRYVPRNKSKEKFDGGEGKEEDKSPEERKVKRGGRENLKQWTKRGKGMEVKGMADGKEQEDAPHHSKEVREDEKKRDPQRSPEETELQMIARRPPEEGRVSEEEGSASRKAEVSFSLLYPPTREQGCVRGDLKAWVIILINGVSFIPLKVRLSHLSYFKSRFSPFTRLDEI